MKAITIIIASAVAGITFQFTYAIGQMLAGPLINRLSTKCAYALSVVVWSFAVVSHALAAAEHQGW